MHGRLFVNTDGLARSRRPEICKKFEASDRLRLNVLGVSNGKETPQMDQILTFVDFLRDHQYLVMKAAPAGLETMCLDGVCNPVGERTSAKGLSSLARNPRLRFTFTAPSSASLTHGVSSNCMSADSKRGVCSVSAGSHRRAPGCRANRCRCRS